MPPSFFPPFGLKIKESDRRTSNKKKYGYLTRMSYIIGALSYPCLLSYEYAYGFDRQSKQSFRCQNGSTDFVEVRVFNENSVL